jgi:hypothetical protein
MEMQHGMTVSWREKLSQIDHTFFLNIVFAIIGGILMWLHINSRGGGDRQQAPAGSRQQPGRLTNFWTVSLAGLSDGARCGRFWSLRTGKEVTGSGRPRPLGGTASGSDGYR